MEVISLEAFAATKSNETPSPCRWEKSENRHILTRLSARQHFIEEGGYATYIS